MNKKWKSCILGIGDCQNDQSTYQCPCSPTDDITNYNGNSLFSPVNTDSTKGMCIHIGKNSSVTCPTCSTSCPSCPSCIYTADKSVYSCQNTNINKYLNIILLIIIIIIIYYYIMNTK